MSKRYFEFSEGSSNKFWEIWKDGTEVFTRYGKIGAAGSTTVKDEGSPEKAQKLYDKLIKEKTNKGYEEKSAAGADPDDDADDEANDDQETDGEDEDEAPPPPPPAAAPSITPGARYFEYVDGSSSKFWEIRMAGTEVFTRYGKIGAAGATTVKDEGSDAKAQKLYDKLVKEKTGKGYVEKTAGASTSDADADNDDDDDDDGEPEDTDGDDSHLDGDSGARRFEHGGSKFWEIRVEGSSHTVRFGKVGTSGQEKTKDFASPALAQKDADKLIAEKTNKGYEEV